MRGWQPTLLLTDAAVFYPTRAAACGREPRPSPYCRLRPGESLAPAGRPRGALLFVEARPFGIHGSPWFALLPETSVVPHPPQEQLPADARMVRIITVAGGKRISLRAYVAAVRLAINNPELEFNQGLSSWWPTSGAQIRRQFLAGLHDRISKAVPWIRRR